MKDYSNKILSLISLSKKISYLKKKKLKIGLCHGVFDLVHIGHIEHFKEAKKYCDVLCVTLTEDKFVNKSLSKPVFDQVTRSKFLSSIEYVDYISVNKWSDSINTLKLLKPDFYIKGPDYKNLKNDLSKKIKLELKTARQNNCKIIFTKSPTQSSSHILNNYTDIIYNEEQKEFLKKIKSITNFENLKNDFKKMRSIKALVIGEAIIDQYIKCEPLGKSGKEPILMFKKKESKFFIGGALHIANNISLICQNINLFTMIGDDSKYSSFIKQQINKSIKISFYKKKESTTILKTRYLDEFNNTKIFGTYDFTENSLDKKNVEKFIKKISVCNQDLIIVSDYSHGFLNELMIKKIISKKKSFVAVNAQLNAANINYHNLMNYNGCNLLIINETELRHQTRDKVNTIENCIKNFIKNFKCDYIVITRGSNGSLIFVKKPFRIYQAPAFTSNVVDKIGAGDTMLSIIAVALCLKLHPLIAVFLGNIAGRMAVESMGNVNHFQNNALLRKIDSMLK